MGLQSAIAANNNQMRMLFLAVASSNYRDTMQDSCISMLKTASTIARKLGVMQSGKEGEKLEKLGPTGLGKSKASRGRRDEYLARAYRRSICRVMGRPEDW